MSRRRRGRSAIIRVVLRHLLAPIVPRAAGALQIARTLPGAPGVVLTFDDGPHSEGTAAVLELLARARLRAMFFLVGEQVARRPALAREIADRGHAIGVHCDRHRLQPRLSAHLLQDDLRRAIEKIEGATAVRPEWHRPPYGIYSAAGLRLAREAGLGPLLWSRWGKDWRRSATPAGIAARATRDLGPGDVILLHDADFYSAPGSHRRTVRALELIVKDLEQQKIDTVLPV